MAFVVKVIGGAEFAIGDASESRIGTHAHCECRLPPSSGLLPIHAQLRKVGGRWLLEGTGDATFSVNGGRAGGVHWLDPGCIIQCVGTATKFEFRESGPAAVPAPIPDEPATKQPPWLPLAIAGSVALVGLICLGFLFGSRKSENVVKTDETQSVTESSAATNTPVSAVTPAVTPVSTPATVSTAVAPPAGGIVWIGLWDDRQSMICTGWVAAPDRIVTVGRIHEVASVAKELKAKLFIYCPQSSSPIVVVKELRVHPLVHSPDYDLTELIPETPLPSSSVCRIVEAGALRAITESTKLTGYGFEIVLIKGQEAEDFDQLRPPERMELSLNLKETRSVPNERGAPTFLVKQKPKHMRQGWAVLDDQGYIIGTWVESESGDHYVLPIDRLPSRSTEPEKRISL